MSEEIVLVSYEVQKSRLVRGQQTWTLYRVNANRQRWSITDYTDQAAALEMARQLTAKSHLEIVHLFTPREG